MENNHYTEDVEEVLKNIRFNSIILYKEHQMRYIILKNQLKYYKIPIIFISSISSIISVSQQFIPQEQITLLNSIMSFVCSIIGAVELYIGIANQMVLELSTSKDYQILAMDIYKCLALKPENRSSEGRAYLEQCYGTYIKLIENSCIVCKKLEDKMCKISPKDIQSVSLQSTPRLSGKNFLNSYNIFINSFKKSNISSNELI